VPAGMVAAFLPDIFQLKKIVSTITIVLFLPDIFQLKKIVSTITIVLFLLDIFQLKKIVSTITIVLFLLDIFMAWLTGTSRSFRCRPHPPPPCVIVSLRISKQSWPGYSCLARVFHVKRYENSTMTRAHIMALCSAAFAMHSAMGCLRRYAISFAAEGLRLSEVLARNAATNFSM
jgi:hypothetical protein